MRIERLVDARRRLALIALITIVFGCAFVLVYVLTVRTVEGRLLGDASLRGALLTQSRFTGPVEGVLNAISVASLLGVVAVVAVVALIRLARLPGLAAIGILVGSNVSTLLLKDFLLIRPDLGVTEVTPATLNSLPSGHATAAFSAVAALLFVLPRRWRLTVVTLGAAYATATALATMSAGWHRAGDAIAAFLLVGVWSMAAAAFMMLGTDASHADAAPTTGSPIRRKLEATAVGCLGLGVAVGLVLTAISAVRDTAVGSAAAFIAGGLLIAGTAVAVLIAVLAALELVDSPDTAVLPRPKPDQATPG